MRLVPLHRGAAVSDILPRAAALRKRLSQGDALATAAKVGVVGVGLYCLTPGCRSSYMDHTGCHQKNRVLTAQFRRVKCQPYVGALACFALSRVGQADAAMIVDSVADVYGTGGGCTSCDL
jgi:hypothetical protein